MKKQDYQHHKMYYIPHHLIFLPLMMGCIFAGVYKAFTDSGNGLQWALFALLSFCILYLGIMLRQHYALGNQNRIVRLECRLRYFELAGTSFSAKENNLSLAQITALRFADDDQFLLLIDKAIMQNITANEIKKTIKHWQADNMRL